MPELNEQQKKRYEYVKASVAKMIYDRDNETGHRHPEGIKYYLGTASLVLSGDDIAILDEDQTAPGVGSIAYEARQIQEDMLQSGFRRVLPKGGVK